MRPSDPPPFEPADWNFDSIPDHHLIACCYWEYARESAYLRELKTRCVEANLHPKELADAFQIVGKDARRILTIGNVANSFLLGFGFAPDLPPPITTTPITGTFPAPWQTLSPAERDIRTQLAANQSGHAPEPFARASGADAVNALLFMTDTIVSSLPRLTDGLYQKVLQEKIELINSTANPYASYQTQGQPTQSQPQTQSCTSSPSANPSSPPPAISPGQPPPSSPPPANSTPPPATTPHTDVPSLVRLDTHSQPADEFALVHIQWGAATDDQLVDSFRAWLKQNRPADVRPGFARGHKPRDWRANLTRLAVMRLLTRFSALELLDPKANRLPALWESKQFSGTTWLDVVKWHDARRQARRTFHDLFPFLPANDNPISWSTQDRP